MAEVGTDRVQDHQLFGVYIEKIMTELTVFEALGEVVLLLGVVHPVMTDQKIIEEIHTPHLEKSQMMES